MKEYLVYLAGPITGIAYAGSTDWREHVTKLLPPHIRAISPMRGKEYLKHETDIQDAYTEHPLSTQKGITVRDRNDTMRADLLLINFLGATSVSKGTLIEMGWADAKRIPIVIAMEENNVHQHAMVRELAWIIVNNLESAVAYVTIALSP